jgi:peptidoglycan/xylan/chitin deacetylase (PgdA/CDA1 family)
MRALSLLYHDVITGEFDASGFQGAGPARYKLLSKEFERHLEMLAAVRPEGPISVGELPSVPQSPLPVLLTFDDGGASAVLAADMLESRGWRGHFLITVKPIGTPAFVGEGEIRELHRRGHTIGSHSFSHPDPMSRCDEETLTDEWSRSVRILEGIIGGPVTVASVPGGSYSRAVVRAAASAGIRALFTSEPVTTSHSVDGCVVLGRYTLRRGMPPQVVAALAAGNAAPLVFQFVSWNARKAAKALGGRHYLWLRRALLARGGTTR